MVLIFLPRRIHKPDGRKRRKHVQITQWAGVSFLFCSCLAWKLEREKSPPESCADQKYKRLIRASSTDPLLSQTKEKSFLLIIIFPFPLSLYTYSGRFSCSSIETQQSQGKMKREKHSFHCSILIPIALSKTLYLSHAFRQREE